MAIKFINIIAAVLLLITACSKEHNTGAPNVANVTYRETSGAISPDSAWSEIYAISSKGLIFERNGFSESTTVNTGTWSVNGFGANESRLLTDLSGDNAYNIQKTGQDTAPIGGGLKTYTIVYDDGDKREVVIGDGSVYNDTGPITTPVNEYISNVKLPLEASKRYK